MPNDPPPIMRNVLASPLPSRAYIRVRFACSGKLVAEEEGAGRLCPPLPFGPRPLATQFQLRCNARSFAQRTPWAPTSGLGKHTPTRQKGTKARSSLPPSSAQWGEEVAEARYSVVCILERAPSMKMGGVPLLLDFIF